MPQAASFVGLVTSHVRTPTGGKGLGTFWGNCPKFELAPSPNAVERNSSMDVSRPPYRRMTSTTALACTVATDEFSKANFARSFHGRSDDVVADTVNTKSFTCPTGAVVGSVLAAPDLNINTVTITDSTGTPKTLTAGVNYVADDFSGHYTLLDITTGGPFVQPFKLAYKQGAVTVISGLVIPDTEVWMALAGTNADDGQRGHLDVYRVRFDPVSVFAFINADYTDMEIKGTALSDSTKQASSIGGNIFRFGLPATHD